ncbi:MAG: ATP-binding protein [Pseudomonadota bacterium]
MSEAVDTITDRQLLNALPKPVIAVGPGNRILSVNYAAQQFFLKSEKVLLSQTLKQLLGDDAGLATLVDRARAIHGSLSGYDITVQLSPDRSAQVDVQVSAIVEQPDCLCIAIERRTIADQMDLQRATRNAARAASGVASMLAHEVKNPLSGIRGAAQLIEEALPSEDAPLAQLIVKETDRIAALVEQMEVFSDDRPLQQTRENIHQILDHVIAVTKSSLGDSVDIQALYDPSLPDIRANWSQLVQVYLNLLLNAGEAVPEDAGSIVVKTAYCHGTWVDVPGSDERLHLPIEVIVTDNGPGVPPALQQSMFDPFVTSKQNGKGLGLALAAKIITDHRGFIGYQRQDGRTHMRTLLPAWQEEGTG